jgi:hypothetical protein
MSPREFQFMLKVLCKKDQSKYTCVLCHLLEFRAKMQPTCLTNRFNRAYHGWTSLNFLNLIPQYSSCYVQYHNLPLLQL